MVAHLTDLIDELAAKHALPLASYEALLRGRDEELAACAAEAAVRARRAVFGNAVYVRALIEFTNCCKNDCLYCGIRRSNAACERYRLADEEIFACADLAFDLGFRTFVLQGGEDPLYDDERLCGLVSRLKATHPECCVTLSVGERSRESYARLRAAGAERFLLRHETADEEHYRALHPAEMSFANRMRCLRDLRDVGFVVGAGFMVGSPGQTAACVAQDLKFIERFQPGMCGIGPYIPHRQTPFAEKPAGTLEDTLFCLSLIRLIKPDVLLPATTALGTIHPQGRELGILAGANVVMPNVSPARVRGKYELYEGKLSSGAEAAENIADLRARMQAIGYEVVVDRGDPPTGPSDGDSLLEGS